MSVGSSHSFSGTRAVIDLECTGADRLEARVRVTDWDDANPDEHWNRPTGWCHVSSAEWSATASPDPFPVVLELCLHDDPMREERCFRGIVEVRRPE